MLFKVNVINKKYDKYESFSFSLILSSMDSITNNFVACDILHQTPIERRHTGNDKIIIYLKLHD